MLFILNTVVFVPQFHLFHCCSSIYHWKLYKPLYSLFILVETIGSKISSYFLNHSLIFLLENYTFVIKEEAFKEWIRSKFSQESTYFFNCKIMFTNTSEKSTLRIYSHPIISLHFHDFYDKKRGGGIKEGVKGGLKCTRAGQSFLLYHTYYSIHFEHWEQ